MILLVVLVSCLLQVSSCTHVFNPIHSHPSHQHRPSQPASCPSRLRLRQHHHLGFWGSPPLSSASSTMIEFPPQTFFHWPKRPKEGLTWRFIRLFTPLCLHQTHHQSSRQSIPQVVVPHGCSSLPPPCSRVWVFVQHHLCWRLPNPGPLPKGTPVAEAFDLPQGTPARMSTLARRPYPYHLARRPYQSHGPAGRNTPDRPAGHIDQQLHQGHDQHVVDG